MIVSPAVSPINGQNPGFGVFTIDQASLTPENWQLTFLVLDRTYGWDKLPSDIALFPFRQVSISQFGLFSLSAIALKDFKNTLEADQTLLYRYLVAKIGYDPNDSTEYDRAMKVYTDRIGIITSPAHKTYKYICQMHKNLTQKELDDCIAANKVIQPTFLSF